MLYYILCPELMVMQFELLLCNVLLVPFPRGRKFRLVHGIGETSIMRNLGSYRFEVLILVYRPIMTGGTRHVDHTSSLNYTS